MYFAVMIDKVTVTVSYSCKVNTNIGRLGDRETFETIETFNPNLPSFHPFTHK